MGKLLKGLILYTLIISVIVTVASGIVLGVMFISSTMGTPFEVFGFKALYLSHKDQPNAKVNITDYDEDAKLNLTIKNYGFDLNVVITEDNTQDIIVRKRDNIISVYKGEYTGLITTTAEYNETENEINATIEVENIDGFTIYGGSNLTVIIPTVKDFPINLKVLSTTGNVNINGTIKNKPEYSLKLTDLSVTTTTGDLKLTNVKSHSSVISALEEDEDFELSADTLYLNKVYLNTNGGKFNLSNITKFHTSSFEIDSDRGDFTFKNVSSKIVIYGKDIKLSAQRFDVEKEGFSFDVEKGFFNIKEIATVGTSNISINTRLIDINIDHIYYDAQDISPEVRGSANITATYGSINIKSIQMNSVLNTEQGNINITENAFGNITAFSNMGAINIAGYHAKTYLETERGNITATFKGEKNKPQTQIEVKTNTGSVRLNNVYNSLKLLIIGNSSAVVNFDSLPSSDTTTYEFIMQGNGKITLNVGLNVPFKLNAKGNVNGTVNTSVKDLIQQHGQEVDIDILQGAGPRPLFKANAGTGTITFVPNYEVGSQE